jgi:hypothetical protein
MTEYDRIVELIKHRYSIRVRRWRRTMTGCAWRVSYEDGRSINWVESPRPRTPLSLSIFLHEVGHHVVGFYTYRRRCEEELAAWRFALKTMRWLGIEPDTRTLDRVNRSMQYAVDKAMRRGIRTLPAALRRYARAA